MNLSTNDQYRASQHPAQRVGKNGEDVWSTESRDGTCVVTVPSSLRLGPELLARLVREIEEVRRIGHGVALACAAGRALETLRKVNFHRFVDILPSRSAALRFARKPALPAPVIRQAA
ncbi:MAG: hypothetical protein MPN21_16155 [Thermoanaerobaculia bacterium]|nr:hypothetical protein [Thermoanaerobaculia bacterium]